MLSDYPFYSTLVIAVVIILVAIVAWYFLRDFVAGVVLKTEVPFEINQQIKTTTHTGTLRKAGCRSIELMADKGECIKIPYSQLSSNSFTVVDSNASQQGHEVILKVKSDLPFDDLSSSIKQSLLLLPWVSVNREPCIKELEHSDDSSVVAVFYHTIGNKSSPKVAHYIRSKFEGLKD
jgi:small-conductance mechanosensitive channel